MLCCGRDWQPHTLNRVIQALPTSTRVVKVATDAGDAFVKGMGNPAGNAALASELVAAELARWFGLSLPDFAIVEIADLAIEMVGVGPMMQGPAFASRSVDGAVGDGSDGFLRRLSNPNDVSALVFFDTWIRNADRCPPLDAFDPEPRRDNLFFKRTDRSYEIMALDHTHCFVEGDLEDEIGYPAIIEDPRAYGLFPEFRGFITEQAVQAAATRLRVVDARVVEEIVGSVPAMWGPSIAARRVWADVIVRRGRFVATTLPDRLIDQSAFDI
jgi:hypothetical protein